MRTMVLAVAAAAFAMIVTSAALSFWANRWQADPASTGPTPAPQVRLTDAAAQPSDAELEKYIDGLVAKQLAQAQTRLAGRF
jgi:hypothetical protein